MKKIYVCRDEVTGLLSAVYDAWRAVVVDGVGECGIRFRGCIEQELFCEYTEVAESEKKAAAVERLILRNLGWYAYKMLYQAALSTDALKGDAILGTMLEAREIPDSRRIMDHLGNAQVEKVFELSRNVGDEVHRWLQFLRFGELENGIMFSKFEPKNRVLTCVAPHFADRFCLENWMIYDETHQEYAVHEAGKQWVLVTGGELAGELAGRFSDRERVFRELWHKFTDSIAIEERKNPGCQMGHLPLWYRKNMVEFMPV